MNQFSDNPYQPPEIVQAELVDKPKRPWSWWDDIVRFVVVLLVVFGILGAWSFYLAATR